MSRLPGLLAALALVLLAAGPALAGSLARVAFDFGGHERRYTIYTPDGLARDPRPRPLLLVLHGIASTDELVMEKSRGRFNALADRHGFIVVYPVGLARTWDVGEGLAAALVRPRRDDLAFLDAVFKRVSDTLPVDPGRVFVAGFSLGGQMAFSWTCKRPGRVRGVASVAMPLPAFLQDDCTAAPTFGVVLIHGTADPWVPYYGGPFRLGPKRRDNYLSHDQTITLFLAHNVCDEASEQRDFRDAAQDGTSVVIRWWRRCKGPPVKSYAIIGGGHTWPREEQLPASRAVVGRVSQEIDAADEIWDFFAGLR